MRARNSAEKFSCLRMSILRSFVGKLRLFKHRERCQGQGRAAAVEQVFAFVCHSCVCEINQKGGTASRCFSLREMPLNMLANAGNGAGVDPKAVAVKGFDRSAYSLAQYPSKLAGEGAATAPGVAAMVLTVDNVAIGLLVK